MRGGPSAGDCISRRRNDKFGHARTHLPRDLPPIPRCMGPSRHTRPSLEDGRASTASCRIDICVIPETMHAAVGPTDGIDSMPSTPI